jgi:hypothetical protein
VALSATPTFVDKEYRLEKCSIHRLGTYIPATSKVWHVSHRNAQEENGKDIVNFGRFPHIALALPRSAALKLVNMQATQSSKLLTILGCMINSCSRYTNIDTQKAMKPRKKSSSAFSPFEVIFSRGLTFPLRAILSPVTVARLRLLQSRFNDAAEKKISPNTMVTMRGM